MIKEITLFKIMIMNVRTYNQQVCQLWKKLAMLRIRSCAYKELERQTAVKTAT